MGQSTPQQRQNWKAFECAESAMIAIPFGPDRIKVAPPTVDAWRALAAVLDSHGYQIRTADTDSYNCREITGGSGRSLHSYGIALDVNWTTNPYIDHKTQRAVRYSNKPTQAARALDVKATIADTDMTPEMIADVRAIKTNAGLAVFEWGGDWRTVKDCMHFEIDVSPAELAAGVDWATVNGQPFAELRAASGAVSRKYRVIARQGLRLRSGPGTEFAVINTQPLGTVVNVLTQSGPWWAVDMQGDGAADGHMHSSYLEPV